MNIFELKGYVVTFSPQALMLKPFKEIWNNDLSKDKAEAVKELSYVYYMADERSDFMYILNEEERHEEVIRSLELGHGAWIIPDYVKEAIEYYINMSETTSTRMLRSTRGVVEKISSFFDAVDVNERDPRTNKPIFNVDRIVASVEKIPKLVRSLNEIEQEIVKEKELKNSFSKNNGGVFDSDGI